MSSTYVAVFVGSRNSPKMVAWNALSEPERKAKEKDGIAAWKAWVEKHQGAIAEMGGPLGKTKRVGPPALCDLSRRSRRDHAGHADSGRLTSRSFT
jgi:hypothetical protein